MPEECAYTTKPSVFLCYWNKNRKGKEKKREKRKKKSLKFLDFLDRISVEESCKVGWPWALGGVWHRGSCSPGCSAPGLGLSCLFSQHISTARAITRGEHREAFLCLAPNKGLLETPAHPIHCGERSHAQECCIFPEKPILEVVAGPVQLSGAPGQGDGWEASGLSPDR